MSQPCLTCKSPAWNAFQQFLFEFDLRYFKASVGLCCIIFQYLSHYGSHRLLKCKGSLIKSRDSQELAPYRWQQKSQGFQRWSVAVVAFLWPLLVFLSKLYLRVSLNSIAKARQCLCHHMCTGTAHFPSQWEILWLQGQLLCFPNVMGQWTQACTPAYRFP